MGSSVNVTGTLAKDSNDELMINAATVTAGDPVNQPATVGTKNTGICGTTRGNAQGSDVGVGPNTVGALQTTWGKVSALAANSSMIVDDGSSAPVPIVGPTGNATNGCFVAVTGIASIQKNAAFHISVLRTRSASDVSVY